MKHIIFILFVFYATIFYSQNRNEIAAYNIGLGGVFGGVGAIINKEPNEKIGKVFLKGLWQGAVGGYLIYESKNLVGKISQKKKWSYSWAAKVTNAAGTSIVENAASNRNLWEQWHLHIGFNRLEFYTKEGFRVKYKIMPISLALTISTAIDNKFEFKKSMETGELIFSNDILNSSKPANAYVLGNVMVIKNENLDNYSIFSHEAIHIYQYYDYNFVNAYLNKPYARWGEKFKLFNTVQDWVYFDLNALVLRGLYLLEGTNNACHYSNFFEYEAEFFSTNGHVICD